jgi:hypothetical protein
LERRLQIADRANDAQRLRLVTRRKRCQCFDCSDTVIIKRNGTTKNSPPWTTRGPATNTRPMLPQTLHGKG